MPHEPDKTAAASAPRGGGIRASRWWAVAVFALCAALGSETATTADSAPDTPVASAASRAQGTDGRYVTWVEHLIDGPELAGEGVNGGDGLEVVDLDLDGYEDIVSVHESDTRYDGTPDGYVRAAFGSADPAHWDNVTLVSGADAGAPEDVAIADMNGDGYPDVMVASELGHLTYLQNPGEDSRDRPWARTILEATRGRGSFIKVYVADFDGDGVPTAVAANKGTQNPTAEDLRRLTPVSLFHPEGRPLDGARWHESVLGRFPVPQNCAPVDIDGDGDLDIVAGVRGEGRLVLFEHTGAAEPTFRERPIPVGDVRAGGFNLDFADIDGDGRLDIVSATSVGLAWLQQPATLDGQWRVHRIGDFRPDSVTGFALADIDGDGVLDVMAGSYSRGPRDRDGNVGRNSPLGRIGWFRQVAAGGTRWERHDVSRRVRGMFDGFVARDIDRDGDVDFIGTRGNSGRFDGVFWLEQRRSRTAAPVFVPARTDDSREMPLPDAMPDAG